MRAGAVPSSSGSSAPLPSTPQVMKPGGGYCSSGEDCAAVLLGTGDETWSTQNSSDSTSVVLSDILPTLSSLTSTIGLQVVFQDKADDSVL